MPGHFPDVDAYIGSLPPEVVPFIQSLRAAIRAAAPGAVEAIKYNMPVFRQADSYILYLAAWKRHAGLYPVARGDAEFEAALAPFRAEKDTVQLRYRDPVPQDLIRLIVQARLAVIAAK